VHGMKSITSVLDVETDRVDNAVGACSGGLHGAFVMCFGGDLFDAIVPGARMMPRENAYPGAGRAQMAHDATANKAAPAKRGYAAHSPIREIILCDAVNRSIKCGTHGSSGLYRRAIPIYVKRTDKDGKNVSIPTTFKLGRYQTSN